MEFKNNDGCFWPTLHSAFRLRYEEFTMIKDIVIDIRQIADAENKQRNLQDDCRDDQHCWDSDSDLQPKTL